MIVYADELLKHGGITHIVLKKYTESTLKGDIKISSGMMTFKPTGVWLSWNNGWQRWCKSEEFLNLENYDQLNVELTSTLKFWFIDSIEDFHKIWVEYVKKNYKSSFLSILDLIKTEKKFGICFWDWLRDVKKLDGIALTDKGQWATRMNTFFYGWDVSTVFLFHTEGIKMTRQKKVK